MGSVVGTVVGSTVESVGSNVGSAVCAVPVGSAEVIGSFVISVFSVGFTESVVTAVVCVVLFVF